MDALQQQTCQGDQVGRFHFNLGFRNSKMVIAKDREEHM